MGGTDWRFEDGDGRWVSNLCRLCTDCHGRIHVIFPNKVLSRKYRTIEALRGYRERFPHRFYF